MAIHILKLAEDLKIDADELQDILEASSVGQPVRLNGLFIYPKQRKAGKQSSSIFHVGIWDGPIEDRKSKCRFNGEIFAWNRIELKTLEKKHYSF